MSPRDAEKPRTTAIQPQRLFRLPSDATEVLLLRHGSTVGSADGAPFPRNAEGHGDPPLSDDGYEQAELVGERLAREPLTRLFVTTLQRTHQTAAPLAARNGLTPEVIPELREIHLGDWEDGEYRKRIAARDPLIMRSFAEQRWDIIPGAERGEAFAERVRRGFDRVVEAAGRGASVVAVVHGGVIAELCRQATGSTAFAFLGADNTSISRLVVFGSGHLRLRSYNDTTHLDELRARNRSAGDATEELI